MMRALVGTFAATLALMPIPVRPQEMGIVTGPRGGTYAQMGEDISRLVRKESSISLKIHYSSGSVKNLIIMLNRPGVQIGLVQSDVLDHVNTQLAQNPNIPGMKRVRNKLRMVFPLHDEEVHVVAPFRVSTFDDLSGKRVAVGTEDSGTTLTSDQLFETTGVKPGEKLHLDAEDALRALKNGGVDAMIYVVGAPASIFSQGITEDDKLNLVNLDSNILRGNYVSKTIYKDTYSWLEDNVQTISVKAVLMSFDFHHENCQNVRRVAEIVRDNIGWLQTNGHEKWREVNLYADLPGWEPYACVHNMPAVPKGRDGNFIKEFRRN